VDGRDKPDHDNDAIRFHIEGLQADGLEVPEPTSIAGYVEA
jgi:predicted RNase H-like HicB family nuclease